MKNNKTETEKKTKVELLQEENAKLKHALQRAKGKLTLSPEERIVYQIFKEKHKNDPPMTSRWHVPPLPAPKKDKEHTEYSVFERMRQLREQAVTNDVCAEDFDAAFMQFCRYFGFPSTDQVCNKVLCPWCFARRVVELRRRIDTALKAPNVDWLAFAVAEFPISKGLRDSERKLKLLQLAARPGLADLVSIGKLAEPRSMQIAGGAFVRWFEPRIDEKDAYAGVVVKDVIILAGSGLFDKVGECGTSVKSRLEAILPGVTYHWGPARSPNAGDAILKKFTFPTFALSARALTDADYAAFRSMYAKLRLDPVFHVTGMRGVFRTRGVEEAAKKNAQKSNEESGNWEGDLFPSVPTANEPNVGGWD